MFNILLKFTLSIFCFITTINELSAQSLENSKEALSSILATIEQENEYSFNFDPDLVKNYQYEGDLKFKNIDSLLLEILFDTPLHFEKKGTSYLIIKDEKKNYKICGYIKSNIDEESLSAANILLPDTTAGTMSDHDGYFEFEVEAYKNDVIQVSYIGYEEQVFMLQNFRNNHCKEIKLNLDPNLLGSEIVIRDYIQKGISEGDPSGAFQMDYEILTKNISDHEHDIFKSIQLLPGISSTDESATRLNIRGSSPDQNLLLWEDLTLYDQGHLFGMISSINPFVVDKVTIYKGVSHPSYENRIGGIIDIKLPEKISSKPKSGIGTTFTEAHAYIETPIVQDKLGIIIAGRNTINNWIQTPTVLNYTDRIFQYRESNTTSLSDDDEFEESELNYNDFNAKILYQPTKKLSISSSFISNYNKLEDEGSLFDMNLNLAESIQSRSIGVSTKLSYLWSDRNEFKFSLGMSDYESNNSFELIESDFEEDDFISDSENSNGINDIKIMALNTWFLSDEFQIDLGYEYEDKDVRYSYNNISSFDFDFATNANDRGTFHNLIASAEMFLDRLNFMGGMRASRYNEYNKWYFSPRISAQLRIYDNLKLKLAGAYNYQFVSQLQDVGNTALGQLTDIWTLANPDHNDVMSAKKISAGIIYGSKGWLADLEFYNTNTNGISFLSNNQNTEFGPNNLGSATNKGMDLLIKKNWRPYSIWFNYSLSKNDNLFPFYDNESFPSSNDQRHNLSVVNNLIWKNISFTLSYYYKTGLPYSIPQIFEIDEFSSELFYNKINDQRLIDYSRVDLGITYKSPIKKTGLTSEFSFSVHNLFNRSNILSREYIVDNFSLETNNEVFSLDRYLLTRTPKLLFRVYW